MTTPHDERGATTLNAPNPNPPCVCGSEELIHVSTSDPNQGTHWAVVELNPSGQLTGRRLPVSVWVCGNCQQVTLLAEEGATTVGRPEPADIGPQIFFPEDEER